MATKSKTDTPHEQRMNAQFPSKPGCITATPLSVDIASVRRGEHAPSEVPWLLPANRAILNRRSEIASETRFDRSNPADMREYSDRIRASLNNQDAAADLAAYRIFELTSDVMASPFALGAFQGINLSDDELPGIIRPRSRNYQRFTIRTIGQDGGSRQDQIKTTKAFSAYEMDLISTDKVEYNLYDIQQGDVEGVEIANSALEYDMDMKIDSLAESNMFAAKTVSGLRDLLNIHPLIVSANLPDTNYLDLNSLHAGNSGVLTIEKLKSILDHIAKFGAVGGDGVGETLTIQSIVMSPQNLRDPWDFIDLVASGDGSVKPLPGETVPREVRNQIFQTGMFTSAWGQNFSWIPNGRIAKGRMYVFTNQPLGWFFTKTNFDRLIRWDGPDNIEQNYGQMVLQRCLQFVIPDLWKHRVLICDL